MDGIHAFVVKDLDDKAVADSLAQCWMEVANAGGAVGFPFPPVDLETAQQAVGRLAQDLARGKRFVVGASSEEGGLVGWVTVRLNDSPVVAHWGKLEHLQSLPSVRGLGVGGALLRFAVDHARSIGLEQLVLVARGGERLEPFYEHHGWTEIGRHTNALRFADADTRDEVTMAINLLANPTTRRQ